MSSLPTVKHNEKPTKKQWQNTQCSSYDMLRRLKKQTIITIYVSFINVKLITVMLPFDIWEKNHDFSHEFIS